MWDGLLDLDGRILLWIQEYVRNGMLTPLMKNITHLGDGGRIWILLAFIFLFFLKTRKAGVLVLFSMLTSLVINNMFLKHLVGRIRPYEAVEGLQRLIGPQGDFSFPSGHTGSSFAAAVVILIMCPKKIGVPAMILAVLIGFSRLYLGVHYPSDVIAGAVTGTLIALFVCKAGKKLIHSRDFS